MAKAFEKKVKASDDQGQTQVDALKDLKPKEQTKPIEDKANNQSKAIIIFNDLINKRKKIMSELHDSVDYNNLKFEYVGPTKDVSFYELVKKLLNKEKYLITLKNFIHLEKKLFISLKNMLKMLSDANYYSENSETKEKGLKY